MNQPNLSRRRWLSLGGIVLGASLLPTTVNAIVSTPKPMILRLRNVNTGDVVNAPYTSTVGFNAKILNQLNYLMRDRHENKVKAIDPALFFKLTQIQSRLGARNTEILVLSGYRTAKTNASLRSRSRGVASNSYHIQGKAVDFYIKDIPLVKVKQAAESLNNGGVGFYPRSNFVHVDTGPARTWRG